MNKRIWLITGISSGLGKAMAEAVMKSGDFVIGTFRSQSQVDDFNRINSEKGYALKLDISNVEKIDEVISSLERKFNTIDVLVNNAGMGFIGAIEETALEEARQLFEVNFFGVLKMTQALLPLMRKRKKGHIVQISSHGGQKAFAGFGLYNASKFALEGFSEALEQEVKPLGISVTLVEPGPFRTKFANTGLGEAKQIIEDYNETAGIFRSKLKGVDGKQEGNPVKAAAAIIDIVNSDNPPLRLPLGKTALMTIGMKLKSVSEDLERNRNIAENAVY